MIIPPTKEEIQAIKEKQEKRIKKICNSLDLSKENSANLALEMLSEFDKFCMEVGI